MSRWTRVQKQSFKVMEITSLKEKGERETLSENQKGKESLRDLLQTKNLIQA